MDQGYCRQKTSHCKSRAFSPKTPTKKRGVVLVIPKQPNPEKKDFDHPDKELNESLWVECKVNNNTDDKSQLMSDVNPKHLSIVLEVFVLKSLKALIYSY